MPLPGQGPRLNQAHYLAFEQTGVAAQDHQERPGPEPLDQHLTSERTAVPIWFLAQLGQLAVRAAVSALGMPLA